MSGKFSIILRTPRSRVLDKLTGSQLVVKFPAFYEIRRFITAFKRCRHLSLSWARSVQSMPPYPNSWTSILILFRHLRPGLPSRLCPNFPTKTLYSPLFSPQTCYVPRPSLLELITRIILYVSAGKKTLKYDLGEIRRNSVTAVVLPCLSIALYVLLWKWIPMAQMVQSKLHQRRQQTQDTYCCLFSKTHSTASALRCFLKSNNTMSLNATALNITDSLRGGGDFFVCFKTNFCFRHYEGSWKYIHIFCNLKCIWNSKIQSQPDRKHCVGITKTLRLVSLR